MSIADRECQQVAANIHRVGFRAIASVFPIGLSMVLVASVLEAWFLFRPLGALATIFVAQLGLGSLVWLLWRVSKRPSEVQTSETGLRWKIAQNEYSLRWPDVLEFFEDSFEGNETGDRRRHFRVVGTEGTELVVTPLVDRYEELLDVVKNSSAGPVSIATQREIEDTGQAKFGPVTIAREGVSVVSGSLNHVPKASTLRWQEVEWFDVKGDTLVLKSAFGEFVRVETRYIPNVPTLIPMMSEFARVACPEVEA